MKNRLVTQILVFIVMTILLLCAAGAASAMEITLDEYHSPSEDLVGPGRGLLMRITETDRLPKYGQRRNRRITAACGSENTF